MQFFNYKFKNKISLLTMLIKELLDNQKVIFCGPLFNESDEFLKDYDTVIRTNNFFSIDKNILKSERCDILITNRLYYKFNHNIIIENLDKIKCLIIFRIGICLEEN